MSPRERGPRKPPRKTARGSTAKRPSSLQPEDRPTLEDILAIEPDPGRVARVKALLEFDEPDLTPEVHAWLAKKETRTLSVIYNQLLASVRFTEDDIDDLLVNAVDTHVHGASDPLERLLYEDDIAEDFTNAGMRAMVVKTWYTPSASRNALIQRRVAEYAERHGLRPVTVFGGVTLSYTMGGFNVEAVRRCLGFPGMKYVWMPMVDSYYHRRIVYDDWSGHGLKFTDERGRIIPEVQEILRVIAANDLTLATGHYGYEDSARLIEEARRLGVDRIEVVHPALIHSKHTIAQMKAQVARGAKLMLMSKGLVTFPLYTEPPYAARMIKEIGASNFVHGGDWGQIQNVPHVVGIRSAIKILLAFGVTRDEVRTIFQRSPAEHLGLPPLPPAEKVPHLPRYGFGRYSLDRPPKPS